MSINVNFVNQKLDDEIHGYFDTKGQPHFVSAKLVEYYDARVAAMLLDERPVCGFTLFAKNSDDAIKEIRRYLLLTFNELQKVEDLSVSPLIYLQDKVYNFGRVFQEDD